MKWNHSVPWEIMIDCPWPPSINRYWRAWNNRMVVSTEGKEYKAHMKKYLLSQLDVRDLPLFPTPTKLQCSIKAYPPDRRGRDLDNIQKVLLDCFSKIIWEDDVQVHAIHAEKVYDEQNKDKGYCEVAIKEME